MQRRWALAAALLVALACLASCNGRRPAPAAAGHPREALVAAAMSAGVTDAGVLRALLTVPREQFLPPAQRQHAFENRSLPIGHGQKIAQPSLVGVMTQLLRLSAGAKVLEIGTGCGYQAAVLAELTPSVFTVEIIPELAASARARLERLGYRSIAVKTGDGYLGWPEKAPFDAIIVTCAPDHVPAPLVRQLKEGGRMVVPVGTADGPQTLYLLEKRQGRLRSTRVVPVRVVPLVHRGPRP